MKNLCHLKIVLSTLLGICLVGGVYAGEYMTAEQVKATFTGKTADGEHLKKGYAFTNYFDPNGKLQSIRDGEERIGEWRVNEEGKHCVQWEDNINEYCKPFRDNGDGTFTKIKLKGDKKIEILILKNVRDGNQLGK